MNNKSVFKSGFNYSLDDFYLSNLLNNEQLLNELDMVTLPDVFLKVFGVRCEDSYQPILMKKIELYDKSPAVNSFIYKGKSYWLDKQQRTCLKNVVDSDLENIELVFKDQSLILPSEVIKQFLINLEVYAYKCYVTTAKHLQNASKLLDYSDILNYDYTTGYPEKIILQ